MESHNPHQSQQTNSTTRPYPLNPHQNLKHRNQIHFVRKFWHCAGICTMTAVYNLVHVRTSWILVLTTAAILIPLDLLRLKAPHLNKITTRIFGSVMRRSELENLSGLSYLLFGCCFLLLLNKRPIVTLSLLFLAFGDPTASFVGIRYGKDRIIRNKTLQGTLGAFVICTIIASLFYYFNNIMTERLLIVAPLSGLIGALAELIPLGKLDDNLSFPVLCSISLWLLFIVFGGM